MKIDEKQIEKVARRIAIDIRSVVSEHRETGKKNMRRSVGERDMRILNRVIELLEDINGSIYICSIHGPVAIVIELNSLD